MVTAGPGVGGGQPVTIITGTSTDLLRQVNPAFPRPLLLGLPVILLLSAVVVWLVVRRALRPVEKSWRAA
ncbi:MAG: hypothetical protein ACR2M5_00390 [Nakamurella sp.]